MTTTDNRSATQEFVLRDILVGHCGKILSPGEIDKIAGELVKEIQSGRTAWAFAADAHPPKINAMFETVGDGVVGSTDAPVKRVEEQDDGSFTVVIDHWPGGAPSPIGYLTGSNIRALIDGIQGVMTVSNKQTALHQNPIYAEPPSIVSGRDALQAIANLPTGKNEDIIEGQEQAYRAVEALFPVPPVIYADDRQVAKSPSPQAHVVVDPDVKRRLLSVAATLESGTVSMPIGFAQLAADIRVALATASEVEG